MFPSPLMSPNIFRTEPVEPFATPFGGTIPLPKLPSAISLMPAGWVLLKHAVIVGGLTLLSTFQTGVVSRLVPSIVVMRTYDCGSAPFVEYRPWTVSTEIAGAAGEPRGPRPPGLLGSQVPVPAPRIC